MASWPRLTSSLIRWFAGGLLFLVVLLGAADQPGKKAEPNWSLLGKPDDNRSYLTRLNHLRQELDRFKDDPRWRDLLVQMVGTQYSYVGGYQKALESFDDRADKTEKDKPGPLESFEARDAVAALLDLASRHQVIMINEAHHVPMHRAFTIQLLEGLYRKGFRYFAAETISSFDKSLQSRGYPVMKTGSYIPEPMYADLVRTALRLGYKVVPYEFESATSPYNAKDAVAAQNAREEGQAKNLKERILDKDPKAKIIVHAGYGHITKKPKEWNLNGKKGEVRFMAVNFRKLTGIEPLCADQTHMSEHGKPKNEPADYRLAIDKGLVKDKPVVFAKKDNKFYVPNAVKDYYDMVIFHPRTRYENGRPHWLSLGGRRTAHLVKTDKRPPKGSTYLAQAFIMNEEGPDAVPIDQLEYSADEQPPTLWLPAEKCRLRVLDEGGKTIHEYVKQS